MSLDVNIIGPNKKQVDDTFDIMNEIARIMRMSVSRKEADRITGNMNIRFGKMPIMCCHQDCKNEADYTPSLLKIKMPSLSVCKEHLGTIEKEEL